MQIINRFQIIYLILGILKLLAKQNCILIDFEGFLRLISKLKRHSQIEIGIKQNFDFQNDLIIYIILDVFTL